MIFIHKNSQPCPTWAWYHLISYHTEWYDYSNCSLSEECVRRRLRAIKKKKICRRENENLLLHAKNIFPFFFLRLLLHWNWATLFYFIASRRSSYFCLVVCWWVVRSLSSVGEVRKKKEKFLRRLPRAASERQCTVEMRSEDNKSINLLATMSVLFALKNITQNERSSFFIVNERQSVPFRLCINLKFEIWNFHPHTFIHRGYFSSFHLILSCIFRRRCRYFAYFQYLIYPKVVGTDIFFSSLLLCLFILIFSILGRFSFYRPNWILDRQRKTVTLDSKIQKSS